MDDDKVLPGTSGKIVIWVEEEWQLSLLQEYLPTMDDLFKKTAQMNICVQRQDDIHCYCRGICSFKNFTCFYRNLNTNFILKLHLPKILQHWNTKKEKHII